MALDDVVYETFGFGNDPIVIRKYLAGIHGGAVLDVTDYTEEFIRAGHIVIRHKESDTYRPLPVAGGEYAALPEGCEYVGVAAASRSVKHPFVPVMHTGAVNDVACPYPVRDELKAALKVAVPTLVFEHD